jgi:hypothetical protein
MTPKFAHLITPTGLTAFLNGEQYSIPTDHPNFGRIVAAIQSNRISDLVDLIDIRATVKKFILSDRRFALVNDVIEFNGEAFSSAVTDKVLELIETGNQPAPIFKFLEKVRQNPSKTAQDELLLFCVANAFMIDNDGNIIAYKSVNDNYTDIYSGKISNAVGTVVKMPRHQVDDNRDRTCSYGLHFASYDYASTWAGRDQKRLLVLAVNPANVVSIPSDYNNQKGRCSEYTVLAELDGFGRLPKKAVYTPADFGISAAARRAEEAQAQLDKFASALNRKRELLGELEDEIEELEGRIEAIEDLGGTPSDEQSNELNRKVALVATVTEDIADLTGKILALRGI